MSEEVRPGGLSSLTRHLQEDPATLSAPAAELHSRPRHVHQLEQQCQLWLQRLSYRRWLRWPAAASTLQVSSGASRSWRVCSLQYFIRMFSEMTSQIPKIWMKPYSRGWTPILLNRKTKTMKEIKRTTIVPLERLFVTVNWQKINLGMPPMEVCLTKRASTARQWASTPVSLSTLQSKLSSYSIYHILSLSHQEHNNDDRLYSKPEWHYPRRDGYEYLAF